MKKNNQSPIELFSRARNLGLHRDYGFLKLFRLYETIPKDITLYNLLNEMIESKRHTQIKNPNPLEASAPQEYDNLNGLIILGTTQEGYTFGFDPHELTTHIALIGSSGSGKSTLIKQIAAQILMGNNI